jgi:hypothetical protein
MKHQEQIQQSRSEINNHIEDNETLNGIFFKRILLSQSLEMCRMNDLK